jgi:XTP/dITP diphosphohydrolase
LITQRRIGRPGLRFRPGDVAAALRQNLCQLPAEVKNAHSHRGKAAQQMLALMRERWFAQP